MTRVVSIIIDDDVYFTEWNLERRILVSRERFSSPGPYITDYEFVGTVLLTELSPLVHRVDGPSSRVTGSSQPVHLDTSSVTSGTGRVYTTVT